MLPVVQFSNTAVQHLLAEIVAIPFMLFWTLAVPHRALLGSVETVFFFFFLVQHWRQHAPGSQEDAQTAQIVHLFLCESVFAIFARRPKLREEAGAS